MAKHTLKIFWCEHPGTYPGRLGDRCTGFGAQILAPKNFSSLFFQLYFNKKYVEVAINDFTMHLIFSKQLRRQKC